MIDASNAPDMDPFAPLRQHPRLVAVGALGVGLIMGAFPQARKMIGLGVLRILGRALAAQTGIPKLPR